MAKQEEKVPLKDHEYDGIQEFDNPAPFWWQLFFYLSIFFAIAYYGYYEIGPGKTLDQELSASLAEVKTIQNQNKPSGPDVSQLKAIIANPTDLAKGKATFVSKCAACHVADGGGLVGPNLTDQFWIHGKGKLADIFEVVRTGVPDKGMPGWGALMSNDELNQVVAYVKTLQGTKPANPKAPQGVEVSAEDSKD